MWVLVEHPDGRRVPMRLAEFHRVLDLADEDPALEPAAFWWADLGSRYCTRHGWPAEACRGWLHGPETNWFGQVVTPAGMYVGGDGLVIHADRCACAQCYRRSPLTAALGTSP